MKIGAIFLSKRLIFARERGMPAVVSRRGDFVAGDRDDVGIRPYVDFTEKHRDVRPVCGFEASEKEKDTRQGILGI